MEASCLPGYFSLSVSLKLYKYLFPLLSFSKDGAAAIALEIDKNRPARIMLHVQSWSHDVSACKLLLLVHHPHFLLLFICLQFNQRVSNVYVCHSVCNIPDVATNESLSAQH